MLTWPIAWVGVFFLLWVLHFLLFTSAMAAASATGILQRAEAQCFANAKANQQGAYADRNLKLVIGSLGFTKKDGGIHWEFGYEKATVFLMIKPHGIDAHAWLEDEKGDVYDIAQRSWLAIAAARGCAIHIKPLQAIEGVSKELLSRKGLHYLQADTIVQSVVSKRWTDFTIRVGSFAKPEKNDTAAWLSVVMDDHYIDKLHAIETVRIGTTLSDRVVANILGSDIAFCSLPGKDGNRLEFTPRLSTIEPNWASVYSMSMVDEKYRPLFRSSCTYALPLFLDLRRTRCKHHRFKSRKFANWYIGASLFGSVLTDRVGCLLFRPKLIDGDDAKLFDVPISQDPSFSFIMSRLRKTPSVTVIGLMPVGMKPPRSTARSLSDHETSASMLAHWTSTSNQPIFPWHVFLLLRNGDQTCLMQAFASHYTMKNWLNASEELKSLPHPETKHPDHLGNVLPRPYYRGYLSAEKLTELYGDIDSLAKKQPRTEQARVYAKITGIVIKPSYMAEQFCIPMMNRRLK